MIKVAVARGNRPHQLIKWIDDSYYVENFKDADLIIFEGGTDLDPRLYKEEYSQFTNASPNDDRKDMEIYMEYLEIPKIGIRKGAHLMTSLAGARIIQHVTGHLDKSGHTVELKTGAKLPVLSNHHQMMYPFGLDKDYYEILAWASPARSTEYFVGKNNKLILPQDFVEPEVVLYPQEETLAIQPPIYDMERGTFTEYINSIIRDRLL